MLTEKARSAALEKCIMKVGSVDQENRSAKIESENVNNGIMGGRGKEDCELRN